MIPMQTSHGERKELRSPRSLWRNRDFLLLWSGQTISTLGTSISHLALPLLVLALTHSPGQAGLLIALRQAPYLLFSLPAGALIDRWNRKAVMVRCDLVRWLALGSVPLAFALGHLTLVHLAIVAFVEGTAYVLFSLAQISALPQVVSPAHVPQAYALDTITEYSGSLLGPSLGAFIIGLVPVLVLGTMLAYLTDSLSYLVSVLSLLLIRVSFQVGRVQVSKQGILKEIAEGLRFLWKQPLLRTMVLLTTVANFLHSPIDLVIIILAQSTLHLDVQMIGFILSAGGVGGVLGGLVAPWVREHVRFGHIVIGSVIIWAIAALTLALVPLPIVLIVGRFLLSFTWPAYGVTLVSYRLSLTPDELQGRVNSAFRFLSYGSEPLGAALGGLLLAPLGPQAVLGLIAAGFAVSTLAVSATELRRA
jgi:MFS family permease